MVLFRQVPHKAGLTQLMRSIAMEKILVLYIFWISSATVAYAGIPVECGTVTVSESISRVVGGNDSYPGQWPWQGWIHNYHSTRTTKCGATLIRSNWVVTAAHCFSEGQLYSRVYLGVNDANSLSDENVQVHYVEAIHTHPDYSARDNYFADIAVVKLYADVQINDYVRPACLPTSLSTISNGQKCIVSGFGDTEGTTSSSILQWAEVAIIAHETCNDRYSDTVPDDHICAGYAEGKIDTCQGDSGGPLVCSDPESYVLYGVTSFGTGCADEQKPGTYTDVRDYLSWIEELVDSEEEPKYIVKNAAEYYETTHSAESGCSERGPNKSEVSCGVAPLRNKATERIVNGNVSKAGSWPWQVLVMKNRSQICGGTIISKDWILTAAHCFEEPDDVTLYEIYVGAHYRDASGCNAQQVKVHLYIIHPGYDTETFKDDVCLIKLTESMVFNNYVVPVCLPANSSTIEEGEKVFVTGWGVTEDNYTSDELREAQELVLNRAECSDWYEKNPDYSRPIPKSHFCAGYREGLIDTCQGDSGGPLVHEETVLGVDSFVLRGVTSFGVGCAVPKQPGVYVTVADYISWINQKVAQTSEDSCRPVTSGECDGEVTESRIIRSPSFLPNYSYLHDTGCKWNITAPTGFWIRFNFICYFLLSLKENNCDDYVEIVSATDSRKFCGNQLPKPYLVESSSVMLKFSSNGSLEYPGFVVRVEFIDQTTEAVTATSQPQTTEAVTATTQPQTTEAVTATTQPQTTEAVTATTQPQTTATEATNTTISLGTTSSSLMTTKGNSIALYVVLYFSLALFALL